MLNLLRAEFYKLSKSLGMKICFLLSCLSAGGLIIISHYIAVGTLSKDISGSASGLTEIVIVSLLGSLMTGIIICTDFESKAVHDSVASGNGRSAIVLSKTLIYLFVMAVLLLPYMAATLIAFCTGIQLAPPFVVSVFMQILSDGANMGVTAGNIAKMLVLFLVTIVVDAARLSVCIPIAFKIRKPVAILAIGFAFSVIIDLVMVILSKVDLLKKVISFTPYSRDFVLGTLNTSSGTLLKAVFSGVVFLGLMVGITYATFRKAEIK